MKLTFTHCEDGFNADIECDFIARTGGTGLWGKAQKGVRVTSVGVFIGTGEGEWVVGDIGIYYDEATWNNEVDGLIYTDKQFLQEVQEQLKAVLGGVADDFSYSEQGMQDDGRVSCDIGETLEEYLRAEAIKAQAA
jgi:hypothetical protein